MLAKIYGVFMEALLCLACRVIRDSPLRDLEMFEYEPYNCIDAVHRAVFNISLLKERSLILGNS